MENNGQGSPSHSSANAPKNPSSPSDEETYSSPNTNTNTAGYVMTNPSGSSDVIDHGQGGVTVTHCISIMVRNPVLPPPAGAPPAPPFSPSTRARIIHILVAQRIAGDYEYILQRVARTIADFHPYLINDNVITIPQSHRIYITQYGDEEISFTNASAEDSWDHVDILDDDMSSQETGEIVFYDASSDEGNGDGSEAEGSDIVDDDMTLEELLALEAIYGLPAFVILRELKSEEYKLTSNTQHEESCRICLELYKAGDRTAKLVCGDRFHYECISQWLTFKNVCPLCRGTGIYP